MREMRIMIHILLQSCGDSETMLRRSEQSLAWNKLSINVSIMIWNIWQRIVEIKIK